MLKEFFGRQKIDCFGELAARDLRFSSEEKKKKIEKEMGGIASAVIFLIPYHAGQKTTNLSVYAQPRDYHLYAKHLSAEFGRYLEEKKIRVDFRVMADATPLDERDAALRAGLGVRGKHGLVMNETYGSFFFIGEIFLSRAIDPQEAVPVKICPSCGACEKACPTGAIFDPERKKCLSLITQKKEWTPEEEILMAKTLCKWGCDLCQSVCPMNKSAKETPIDFFRKDHISHLTPDAAALPKEEFLSRAFSWRGRQVLLRNLDSEK